MSKRLEEFIDWLQREKRPIDRAWSIIFLVAALVLFTFNLNGLPLRDWDEGLVAQVAREIWQAPFDSLTWLYPTLWGEPYLNKPPLIHGLIALSYAIGGVNEWTARFPGALLTAISVPLFYSMSREVFYRRTPAVFATLVYLTSLPVLRNGRLAMLDGALLCFAVLMMLCLLRSRRDLRYMLGVGIGLGLICLTKGIMVGLLLGTIALLFLVGDTPRLLKSPYTWIGLLFGCVPVALWYGAQWVHYGQVFLTNNLGTQSFQRIWADVENNHGAPWYYLLEVLKYGAPWVLFLPLGYRLAWQNRNLSWAKLALVWGVVYFLAISLMATKLPWYVLPLYPALALAIGAQLAEFWEQGRHIGVLQSELSPYPRIWIRLFGLIALVAWSGVLFFGLQYSPPETDLQAVMAAVAITMMVVVVLLIQQNAQFLTVLGWGTYLSLLLLMGSDHWVWELAEAYPVEPVAALIRGSAPASQKIYTSYPYNRPSLNFYSNRPVLPADLQNLRRVWRQASNPYLLLDQKSLEALPLKRQKIVGRAEGWVLVTKIK